MGDGGGQPATRRQSLLQSGRLTKDERRDFKNKLRDLPLDEVREAVERLESVCHHQAYKAAAAPDDAICVSMLQRRQDELHCAREVLQARTADTDDDTFHAALLIQCQMRKCLARVEMKRRMAKRRDIFFEQLSKDEQNESALLIQGMVRRRMARKELNRRREKGPPVAAAAAAPAGGGGGGGRAPVHTAAGAVAVASGAAQFPRPAVSPGGARTVPLQTSGGGLLPEYRIQDVSDVPITDDELRALFSEIDRDGNGFIGKKEFKDFYRELESYGIEESDEELQQILTKYNMLGDDKLSYDEFAIIMLRLAQR